MRTLAPALALASFLTGVALSQEELAEYEVLVGASDLVAVLQAKARSVLKGRRAS